MSIPPYPEVFVGRERERSIIAQAIEQAIADKRGRVFFLTGVEGIGKTALLRFLEEHYRDSTTVLPIFVSAFPPIGLSEQSVSQMQPFGIAKKILERIHLSKNARAKKRLWVNIGLTLLTTLPFAGDLVYAFKEISRDLREYQKEKQDKVTHEDLEREILAAIEAVVREQPILLLLDNMEWSDLESVAVLNGFIRMATTQPLIIVVGYHPSPEIGHRYEAMGKQAMEGIATLELEGLKPAEVQQWMSKLFPELSFSKEIPHWLSQQSRGIPLILTEYLQQIWQLYHQGKLTELTLSTIQKLHLPDSVTVHIQKVLSNLLEEELHLLALCSAEGTEATVFLQSQLLGVDPLTTVRRLRALQKKTGIIRLGQVEYRYGVKTTIVEFSHALYQKAVYESLTYEERRAIAASIDAVLEKRLQESQSDAERLEVLPYLWEHAIQEENWEEAQEYHHQLVETMLQMGGEESVLHHCDVAARMGIRPKGEDMREVLNRSVRHQGSEISRTALALLLADPEQLKAWLFQLLASDRIEELYNIIDTLEQEESERRDVHAILSLLRYRLEFLRGTADLSKGERFVEECDDPQLQCFAALTHAQALLKIQNDFNKAEQYMKQAAALAQSLGIEYQLLVLTAITNFYFLAEDPKAELYLKQSEKLARVLGISPDLIRQLVFQG